MQRGPVYFRVLSRCQIFGISVEGNGKQMNYLIDETVTCGKGANEVISLLHHFLECYDLGEQNLEHLLTDFLICLQITVLGKIRMSI